MWLKVDSLTQRKAETKSSPLAILNKTPNQQPLLIMFKPLSDADDSRATDETAGPSLFDKPPDFCPLCGYERAIDATIGVNAILCQNCAENIGLYSPIHYFVYGHAAYYHIWAYPAPIDDWDRDAPPTFLSTTSHDGLPFTELDTADQELVYTLVTDTDPHPDGFESIQLAADGIDDDLVAALNKATTTTPESPLDNLNHLQSTLPKPTLFTPNQAYTTSQSDLVDLLESSTTEQGTLSL
jgi:hypothetical protein